MAINVAATPWTVDLALNQVVYSLYPPRTPNTAYDSIIYLSYASSTDTLISITLHGSWYSVGVSDSTLEIELSLSGSFVEAVLYAATGVLEAELELRGDITIELPRINWVKWSNIGSLDFTIGRDNVAGERPMPWKGRALVVRKLNKSVVVYGENGISVLTPDSYRWGHAKLAGIGLHSRLAICGTDQVHFFVDTKNRLCKLSDKMEILGYDEFIGALSNSLVLSYDEHLQRVFICDGQYGYVYSATDKGLGECSGNITGWTPEFIAAAGTITNLPFEICTDIFDIGSRKDKTIMEVELGVNATNAIYVALDWRKDKTVAFATTPWTRVNPNGRANLPVWGREFRIRIKQLTYEEDFKLDYIKVLGQLHNYSYLDSFLRGRQV